MTSIWRGKYVIPRPGHSCNILSTYAFPAFSTSFWALLEAGKLQQQTTATGSTFNNELLNIQRASNGRMVEIAERTWFVLLARCQHEQNNEDETGGASGMIGGEEKYIEGLGRKPWNK